MSITLNGGGSSAKVISIEPTTSNSVLSVTVGSGSSAVSKAIYLEPYGSPDPNDYTAPSGYTLYKGTNWAIILQNSASGSYNWNTACNQSASVSLTCAGKTITRTATTLTKADLELLTTAQRKRSVNYWTSTAKDDTNAYCVHYYSGDFYSNHLTSTYAVCLGVRLV